MNDDSTGISLEDFDTEEFFRFMFGGEEFHSIIGDFELAKSFKNIISEMLKDNEQTPEQREEQKLQHLLHNEERIQAQEERIKQLSANLILKLSVFTDNYVPTKKEHQNSEALNHFIEVNRADIPNLIQASYGEHLLQAVGYIYSSRARFWLSKMDSQEGHIGKRILGYSRHVHSSWKDRAHTVKEAVKTVKCAVQWGQSMSKLAEIENKEVENLQDGENSQYPFRHHSGYLEYNKSTPSEPTVIAFVSVKDQQQQQQQQQLRKSSAQSVVPLTDEEKRRLEVNAATKSMETLWRVIKLEIESTERDVCDRVLNDISCSRDIRRSRCIALSKLGDLWQTVSLEDSS
ncbi:hypothetical protein I4U23_029116 [Adineta vaga]|nr:hypothetical protein I4U23_029116 [Adineta vaga]